MGIAGRLLLLVDLGCWDVGVSRLALYFRIFEWLVSGFDVAFWVFGLMIVFLMM